MEKFCHMVNHNYDIKSQILDIEIKLKFVMLTFYLIILKWVQKWASIISGFKLESSL